MDFVFLCQKVNVQPFFMSRFKKNCLFSLIGGRLPHNTVVVFPVRRHESAAGAPVWPSLSPPASYPPHPPGCPASCIKLALVVRFMLWSSPTYLWSWWGRQEAIRPALRMVWRFCQWVSAEPMGNEKVTRCHTNSEDKRLVFHRVDSCGLPNVN